MRGRTLAQRAVASALRPLQERKLERSRLKVSRIVGGLLPATTQKSELAFEELQRRYPPRAEYGYDDISVFRRASHRAQTVVGLTGLERPGLRGLEVGAGDGMLGALLTAFGHQMTLTDLEDWRVSSARGLAFVAADCSQALPLPDAHFDFVLSYNAFEHFPDPKRSLSEMVRVTRPGGLLHFDFNPLFCSAWGLHAYRTLRMPYPQFLFSPQFLDARLRELGISDLGKQRTELQNLNRWRPSQFESLWNDEDLEVATLSWHVDEDHLAVVLEYPDCFSGLDLTLRDLTVCGVTVTLRKR